LLAMQLMRCIREAVSRTSSLLQRAAWERTCPRMQSVRRQIRIGLTDVFADKFRSAPTGVHWRHGYIDEFFENASLRNAFMSAHELMSAALL
jgi:hypothetical protein